MQPERFRLLIPALLVLANLVHLPHAAQAAEPAASPLPSSPTLASPPAHETPPTCIGLGFCNPLQLPTTTSLRELCEAVPVEQRQHVNAFLVNGCDPFCVGNMNGLGAYVKSLGFPAEFGQMYSTRSFYHRARSVKLGDPEARLVLMGFSLGANKVRTIAQWLNQDGITVDLLVYLGADAVSDGEATRPPNVQRIVNITGHGSPFFGGDLVVTPVKVEGAENIHLDSRHFGLPSQTAVIDTLVREMLTLAGGKPLPPPPTTVRGVPGVELEKLRIP